MKSNKTNGCDRLICEIVSSVKDISADTDPTDPTVERTITTTVKTKNYKKKQRRIALGIAKKNKAMEVDNGDITASQIDSQFVNETSIEDPVDGKFYLFAFIYLIYILTKTQANNEANNTDLESQESNESVNWSEGRYY